MTSMRRAARLKGAHMHLNAFTDFGLRVLMRLAGEPARTFSARELSEEFDVSRHHLNKVIATMARAGLVATRRGHGGGIALARSARDITLGQVVRVLERRTALVECFRADGGKCSLRHGCLLARHLEAARARFLQALDEVNLAQCAFDPAHLIPRQPAGPSPQ